MLDKGKSQEAGFPPFSAHYAQTPTDHEASLNQAGLSARDKIMLLEILLFSGHISHAVIKSADPADER